MDTLVFLDRPTLDAGTFTTSDLIAEYAEVQHHAVQQLIKQYHKDLEEFGVLAFEMRKLPGRGRPRKVYHLNENQATLLITYLDNTKPVRAFKKALVHQFAAMREELTRRRVLREVERPKRRTLTDAIQVWPYCNQWSYKTLTDLLCKVATGKSTGQIKRERGVSAATAGADIYTAEEMGRYQTAEGQAIALLGLGLPYDQIKAAMSGQGIQITLPAREVSA